MPLAVTGLTLVTASWVYAQAPTTTIPTAPPTVAPSEVEEGRRLYEAGCSTCHGVNGEGSARGPSLIGVGAASADFYLSTGRMPLNRPGGQAERKRPAYSPVEIRRLTAYVASLGPGGPQIPSVDPRAGSLVEGNRLYAIHCASCHNSAGSGGALGHAVYAPPLYAATPLQVAEATRIGPGAMPIFGPDTLNDQQVNSIVRYVEYLKDPEDRGGYGLGHLGPIPEGFVAWVIGLGALLLVARWIGTTD